MAGLVTAGRVYPTCGGLIVQNSGKPEPGAIHVFLAAPKTWMPGSADKFTQSVQA